MQSRTIWGSVMSTLLNYIKTTLGNVTFERRTAKHHVTMYRYHDATTETDFIIRLSHDEVTREVNGLEHLSHITVREVIALLELDQELTVRVKVVEL